MLHNFIKNTIYNNFSNHELRNYAWHGHNKTRLLEFTEQSRKSLQSDNDKFFILIENQFVLLNDSNSDLEFLRQRIYLEFRNDAKGFSCLLLFNRQGINSSNPRIRTMASMAQNIFVLFLKFLETQNHVIHKNTSGEIISGTITRPDKKQYIIYDDDTCQRIALPVCSKDSYFSHSQHITVVMKDFYKNLYLLFSNFYQNEYCKII